MNAERLCSPTVRTLLVMVAAAGTATSGGAQEHRRDSSFHWEADVVRGSRLTVRNLNGNVRVEGGDTDEIIVRGIKSWKTGDPEAITIRISRHGPRDRHVLVCAEWNRATLSCGESSHAVNSDGRNDARLDLLATVPRWLPVAAESINGDVYITRLAGGVSGSVVNGSLVSIPVVSIPRAGARSTRCGRPRC